MEISEESFWTLLMFHVSGGLQLLPECSRLGMWCDGFDPEEFVLRGPGRHVSGRCCMVFRKHEENWRFRLALKDHLSRRDEIPWEYFLPRENAKGWLHVFPLSRSIEIATR